MAARKPTLYLETTVPSYLTSRPSRDVVVLAHQQLTQEWWQQQLSAYEVYVSEAVLVEAQKGDAHAAASRVELLRPFPVLGVTEDVRDLARVYREQIPLPEGAAFDALHLAVATWNEMNYLLTWNCRHIACGHTKRRLIEINLKRGFVSPTVCTPEELLYGDYDVD